MLSEQQQQVERPTARLPQPTTEDRQVPSTDVDVYSTRNVDSTNELPPNVFNPYKHEYKNKGPLLSIYSILREDIDYSLLPDYLHPTWSLDPDYPRLYRRQVNSSTGPVIVQDVDEWFTPGTPRQ